ncbi:MAG: hypothetical protein ACRD0G_16575 [Acidimicrobiales bacterium]
MADEQDKTERLDDDRLADEYPPDRPTGALDYGTTPQEERINEPIEEFARREVRSEPPLSPTASERVPPPPEESAMHVVDDDELEEPDGDV